MKESRNIQLLKEVLFNIVLITVILYGPSYCSNKEIKKPVETTSGPSIKEKDIRFVGKAAELSLALFR